MAKKQAAAKPSKIVFRRGRTVIEFTPRELLELEDRGLAWRIGEQWRVSPEGMKTKKPPRAGNPGGQRTRGAVPKRKSATRSPKKATAKKAPVGENKLRELGKQIGKLRAERQALGYNIQAPAEVQARLKPKYYALTEKIESLRIRYDALVHKLVPLKAITAPKSWQELKSRQRRNRAELDKLKAKGEDLYSGSVRFHKLFNDMAQLEEQELGFRYRAGARAGIL